MQLRRLVSNMGYCALHHNISDNLIGQWTKQRDILSNDNYYYFYYIHKKWFLRLTQVYRQNGELVIQDD